MNPPNENPLTPASLATDGIQGAGAKAHGPSGAQDTPLAASARILALSAIDAARGQLSRYASMTDAPVAGSVEAADLLDAARDMLAQGGSP